MRFGAHLPLIDLGGGPPSLAGLRDYARTAAALDYHYLCANDHLLFTRPWLDGPTALAAVLDAADGMTLVMSTHNLGQAKRLATRVVHLEGGVIRADLPSARFFEQHADRTLRHATLHSAEDSS